jgi:hypothetical protein
MFLEDCMFGPEMTGLDVLGEHLAVVMGREPGLSVAMVLAQLSNEKESRQGIRSGENVFGRDGQRLDQGDGV